MFYSSSQGRRMIACAFCSVRVNAATISSPTSPISSTTPSSPTSTLGPQKGSLHERREGRGHKKSSSSASDTLVNVALAHLNFPGFHRRHSAPLHAPSPLVSPILATKDRSKQGAVSYFDAGRRTSASGAYPAEERSGSQEAHVRREALVPAVSRTFSDGQPFLHPTRVVLLPSIPLRHFDPRSQLSQPPSSSPGRARSLGISLEHSRPDARGRR